VIASAPARAEVIHGHVHDDANHPIAHAVVAFGGSVFGETDATGAFSLDVGSTKGVVWVRVPEGYVPGPVWAAWPGPAELVVHRLAHPATQPLQFVVGSDAHLSEAQTSNGAEDLAMAIRHATESAPAFFSVLGDVTQGGTEAEFDLVEQALPELAGVPWVPVPGNHDWYDGGVAWTKRAGPDNYSFDLAGVHFVVWNMAIAEAQILAFLRGDLSRAKAPIIALTHAPPSKTMRAVLAAHHVGYVLTGHAHSNRLVHHEDGLVEFNTEPLLMGGLDFTPAGYRIFTLDHDQLHSQHRVTLDHSITSVLAPRCIQRELLVAATTPTVTARIDSGTPIAMRSVGGWDWRAELPALAPGPHRVEVNGTTSEIHACEPLAAPAAPNGGLTTSLATRWITPVGGHLLSARPVISGDTIFATVTDLGDGDRGGVIAIDLATGAVRWRTALPIQTRGGVAVVGNIVAVPQIDGVVIGLDATTGLQRWSYELRPHTAPEAQVFTLDLPPTGKAELPLAANEQHYIKKDASGLRYQGTDYEGKIVQLYGDSAKFDFSPYFGTMDLVFVDASHSYEYVLSDSRVARKLLGPAGGVIFWHDYGTWIGVTRALEELRAGDPRFQGLRRVTGTALACLVVGPEAP